MARLTGCQTFACSFTLMFVMVFVWLRGPPRSELQAQPSPGHGRLLAEASALVPVIVLKLPRTGSTWLSSLMRTYPGSKFKDEAFHFESGDYQSQQTKMVNMLSEHGSGFVGFSFNPLLNSDARVGQFQKMLVDVARSVPKLRIIVFERTNVFRRTCARQGKPPFRRNPRDESLCSQPDPKKLEQEIMTFEKECLAIQMSALAVPVPVLRITYEGLQMDTNGTLARIADFLGVPRAFSTKSGNEKKSGDDSIASMRNAAGVRRHFENNTCILDMLDANAPKEFLKPCLLKEMKQGVFHGVWRETRR